MNRNVPNYTRKFTHHHIPLGKTVVRNCLL